MVESKQAACHQQCDVHATFFFVCFCFDCTRNNTDRYSPTSSSSVGIALQSIEHRFNHKHTTMRVTMESDTQQHKIEVLTKRRCSKFRMIFGFHSTFFHQFHLTSNFFQIRSLLLCSFRLSRFIQTATTTPPIPSVTAAAAASTTQSVAESRGKSSISGIASHTKTSILSTKMVHETTWRIRDTRSGGRRCTV